MTSPTRLYASADAYIDAKVYTYIDVMADASIRIHEDIPMRRLMQWYALAKTY